MSDFCFSKFLRSFKSGNFPQANKNLDRSCNVKFSGTYLIFVFSPSLNAHEAPAFRHGEKCAYKNSRSHFMIKYNT